MSTAPAPDPNPVQEPKPAAEPIPKVDEAAKTVIPAPPPRTLKFSNTMKAVLGTLVILVVLLFLSSLHTRSATIQVTATTDVVEVRLGERIGVKGLEVEDAAVTGVTSIRLPTETRQLDPAIPLEVTSAGQTKILAPMTLEMGAPALLQVRRLSDQASSRQFLIRLSPVKETSMPSSITMILQAGQVVRQGEETVFEADQEALVKLLAMGDLEANITIHDDYPGRIAATAIKALSFSASSSEDVPGRREPGLQAASLSFLELPQQSIDVARGADLSLRDMQGYLHSMQLTDSGIIVAASGQVGSVVMSIGDQHRKLQPTLFDWLAHDVRVRLLVAVLTGLGAILTVIGGLRNPAK